MIMGNSGPVTRGLINSGFVATFMVVASLSLAACGSEAPPQPSASATASTTSSTSTVKRTSSTVATSTSKKVGEPDKTVTEARQTFGSLAPASLFDQFEVCTPNGVEGSLACSGKEVGQFQFFASDSKAASSTQLLTGLRNSRVIKDTGAFVVGWSTLGNTAVITVVDNEKGLVMQQMVSTDDVNPTERIYELGLADETDVTTTEPTEPLEETDTSN